MDSGLFETTIRRYVKSRKFQRYSVEEDAVVLMLLFVETGLMDASKITDSYLDAYFERSGETETHSDILSTNENRRITELCLGETSPTGRPWNFHTQSVFHLLGKLETLETLKLHNCVSFPLCETISRFPNLKVLEVSSCENIILRPPENFCAPAPSILEVLNLKDHHMEDPEDLAVFLFEVLPLVTNLIEFRIGSNNIWSFQEIAKRLRNPNTRSDVTSRAMMSRIVDRKPYPGQLPYLCPQKVNKNTIANREGLSADIPPSRLRVLNLGTCTFKGDCDYFFVRRSLEARSIHDPPSSAEQLKEAEAMQTMLVAYRELHTLIRADDLDKFWASKTLDAPAYLMEINYAGRVLVEGNGGISEPLPLGVWPAVLERAWKWKDPIGWKDPNRWKDPKSFSSPNGIYYMLRNVEPLRAVNQRTTTSKTF